MTKELIVILDGQVTGRVVRDTRGRISFTYEDNWSEAESAYPLSLSMPLALSRHGKDKIDPFSIRKLDRVPVIRGDSRTSLDINSAFFQFPLGIATKLGAEFREDNIARMNQCESKIVPREVSIEPYRVTKKIVD